MKLTFDIKAKEALNELIKNSSENYIELRFFMAVVDLHMIYMLISKAKKMKKS